MKLIQSFLTAVLLLFYFSVFAQTRRFKHLTSSDGISQSEVYTFLEDSQGFIWFGTVDGLNRYDGYTLDIFNTNRNDPHSLSNNTVRSLIEDRFGRIWIGTDDGLNVYDPQTELIYQVNINSGESKFSVWSLFIQKGNLILGTASGLWRTEIQDIPVEDLTSNFRKISYRGNQFIRSILNCKQGGIWIVTSNDVSRIIFEQNSDEPVIIEEITFSGFFPQTTAVEDSAGNLWIASTESGLVRYNPSIKMADYFKESDSFYGLSSRKCSSLATDKSGNLWIGTLDRGLNFIKAEDLNRKKINFEYIQNEPFNENSLNSNLIYSLYVSNDNFLWVGTIGAGVNIFSPEQKKFTLYRFADPTLELSNSNFVRSVYADTQNRIWTGTHGNGLFLFDREKNKFQKLGFETFSIFFIWPFDGKKVFICSGSGLHLVELINEKLRIINSNYIGVPVFNVVKGKNNFYWIATLHGLKRIEIIDNKIIDDKEYSLNTDPGLSHNNCRVLFFDEKNNTLLVGTEGGGLNVISLDNNHLPIRIQVYKKDNGLNSLSNNYVRAIIKDEDETETFWIGTYEGLNKMVKDIVSGSFTFKTYTKKDGLPNNMIQLIAEDQNHNLWIGTNGGLSQFLLADERFVNYTVHDGIQSNEFSEHTVFKKPDGEIIMGGINGINAFYPDQIKISSLKPKTTITGFYLFNEKVSVFEKVGRRAPLSKSITLTDTIVLLPRQKNIGFEFSAMIYPNAEKIQYAYMLDGFDNDWHYTDARNRNVNYTNLRHGKYTFKVKSTNSDGIWDDALTEVFLHVQTPFIYTMYAYAIYGLIIILIFIYFSHYTIIRYTTKKKLLLENEHNEKLHELDELRTKFFINVSHDLRTPLTLIGGPLENILQTKNLNKDLQEKLQLIKRNVKRLNYLVEQLLDVRKAESGKLTSQPKSEDIVSFTNEEIAHFTYAAKQKGLKLNVKSNSEQITACFDRAMISKVYFNVISNAIKFTDRGEIVIGIEKVEKDNYEILKKGNFQSYTKVEVRDTGKGISRDQIDNIFERFYQGKKQSGSGYGIGLSHSRELIDAHFGYIEVESTEGVGTIIRFFLPDIEFVEEPERTLVTSTEDIYFNADAAEVYNEETKTDTAKTILVVEDNVDMRSFVKSELKKEYNIVEASDGIEGIKQANEYLPDIIVCDIMMPNMDGIELCEKLKANLATSHIPIILLTAKVDNETKYESIETGADDYIPKPFEIEYLKIRIKNLLHSRDQLRKLFQNRNILEPSKVTVTSIDEKFLSSFMAAIEEGIPDSSFSIHSLESKLGMSHANFYRKIKSLTGQSAQELLLNMRMKRAYQVMSDNKGLRVAEVAYMVGFTNPKYFSKCFKEMFGYAPSELIK